MNSNRKEKMKNILETQKNMICLLVLTTYIPSLLLRRKEILDIPY